MYHQHMDTLLSKRGLGYLAVAMAILVSFFMLIEFFGTALVLAVASVVCLLTLLRLRSMRRP